jgi:hypothetical protein
VTVKGDFAGLERVTKALKKRAKKSVVSAIATAAARAIRPVEAAHLAAGTTPYGEPWAPRKSDGARPLAGAKAKVRARGNTIRASAPYPYVFHNKGTAHHVRRQIVPDDATGIPADWTKALESAATAQLGGPL